MNLLKKIIFGLFICVILCNIPLTYVSASEKGVITGAMPATQDVSKGGVTVTFSFQYTDGVDASIVSITKSNSNYSWVDPPTSYFSGDTCYASVNVKKNSTNEVFILRAWCDIYGQTGTY